MIALTPWETGCLVLGLVLGCVVLAKLLSVGAFTITKKPTARIDEAWIREQGYHDRLQAAADPQSYGRRKGARGAQMRNFQ